MRVVAATVSKKHNTSNDLESTFRSAEKGDAAAQNRLGNHFQTVQPPDYASALAWFRLAANQGDATGQANLAFMHLQAKGIARDTEESKKYFRLAADQGLPIAQVNLAKLLAKDRAGLEIESQIVLIDAEILKLLKTSAKAGNPEAQTLFGEACELGIYGHKKSSSKALEYYERGANQGYDPARIALSKLRKELRERKMFDVYPKNTWGEEGQTISQFSM